MKSLHGLDIASQRMIRPYTVPTKLKFLVGASLIIYALVFSSNTGLAFFSFLSLFSIIKLVTRPAETLILPFVLGLQWLHSSTKIFQADLYSQTVNEFSALPQEGFAIVLSLIGVIVVALGLRFALGTPAKVTPRPILANYSIKKLGYGYFLAVVFISVLKYATQFAPGLMQIVLALRCIEWVFLFLLSFVVFQEKNGYKYLALAFIFDVSAGFFTGFASWKDPIYIVGISYLAVNKRIGIKVFIKLLPLVILLIFFSLTWSVHKQTIRIESANQTFNQRVELIGTMLSSGRQLETLMLGFEILMDRVAYVDYFAKTIQHVPDVVPHTNGELWLRVVSHLFQPRILFPNKPPLISDSVTTYKYTGEYVSGAGGEGTSIGIGYFAESYIDFGFVFMFVPIFLLGVLAGYIYGYILRNVKDKLVAYGIVIAIFVSSFTNIETSNVKMVGSMLTSFLVLAVAWRYGGRRFSRFTIKRSAISNRSDAR